jgi:hypothetical protein
MIQRKVTDSSGELVGYDIGTRAGVTSYSHLITEAPGGSPDTPRGKAPAMTTV